MKAEVISIGTEILLGEIVDTNAAFIASRLPQFGIDMLYTSQVGDNPDRLSEIIHRAWNRSDIIFCTGGLGPTEDDLTRETIAKALNETLYQDEAQAEILRNFFQGRGGDMPERNLKQAQLIKSARAIANPRGTAPGWWVERENKTIVVMPGPPSEMTRMWEHEVAPHLEEKATSILVSRTLKTSGVGEGTLDEMIGPLLHSTNPSIGVYARVDGVHVRISAKGKNRQKALELIEPVEREAREILGDSIWGSDDESLSGSIGRLLQMNNLTLGLMESATGGALASSLTDIDGSSSYFKGSIVTYATEAKIMAGVSSETIEASGVISEETATAMAIAARTKLQSDIGIGITGIAGGEEVEGQPPGTMHIALADEKNNITYSHSRYYQGRDAAKRRAVLTALTMLRQHLIKRN
ncbi:MAG: competence/damage-inducible protein A [Dehalococcoidia bacterium]|nr:competence/damage-inducible protein A [Dehalococcoidia bacterium]